MSEPYWEPLAASAAAIAPAISAPVTTLPVAPTNGQLVVLTDSLTTPNWAWLLQYDAAITGAQKWRFLGGTPFVVSGINGSNTTGSPVAVGTGMTIPVQGAYIFTYGCDFSLPQADFVNAYMDISNGTVTGPLLQHLRGAADSDNTFTQMIAWRSPLVAAASVMRLRPYNSNGASAITVNNGYIHAVPVILG